MTIKKNIDFPVSRVIFIIASFLLAILDMTFLYKALGSLLNIQNGMAMITAFILATIANFTALMWGWESGRHLQERSVNKYSASSFAMWVLIGIVYAAIRIINLVQQLDGGKVNIPGEIVQIIILAISYIGTGLVISSSAREIFDAETSECRRAKKKFDNIHDYISEEMARIKTITCTLSNYDNYYTALDRQKEKIEKSIRRVEDATMADIVGKVIARHPEADPVDARKVKDTVLHRRDAKVSE